jgi:hypothetical protein
MLRHVVENREEEKSIMACASGAMHERSKWIEAGSCSRLLKIELLISLVRGIRRQRDHQLLFWRKRLVCGPDEHIIFLWKKS